MPPHTERIVSPYDVEARYGRKRETEWCGYKTHLTETCDADLPRLITHVETTNAALPDRHALPAIHEDLAAHDRLPACHLVDSGYVDAGELVAAQAEYAGGAVNGPDSATEITPVSYTHLTLPTIYSV